MSFGGLVGRSIERIRRDGWQRFGELLARRFWDPIATHVLRPQRHSHFRLGQDFPLSVPAFSKSELREVYADIERLSAKQDVPAELDVRIAVLGSSEGLPAPPKTRFRVQVVPVDTPRLVLGFVLWSGNVFVPAYLDARRSADLCKALQRLGVEPLITLDHILERIASRMLLTVSGPIAATSMLYRSLKDRLAGAHYGYREPLRPDIVAELPGKFDFFSRYCEINFIPTRNLSRYPGRVSRQYAVGEMYRKPYFQGESLLDVGCDIRGISEYVGEETRYVGVDMQGLADVCIDLDKERLPFAENSFDTVLCFEVLEHLSKIHEAFDGMLSIARRYFVGSLFIESGVYRGRSVSAFGEPLGNMQLPIAPVFDRHEWVFSLTDALDFIYYRSRRAGFRVIRLDIFYEDARLLPGQRARLRRAMRTGNVRFLSKNVEMIGFVVERDEVAHG